MIIHDTFICEDCSQEIPSGLLSAIDHSERCLKNQPSTPLSSKPYELRPEVVAAQAEALRKEKFFDKHIWPKMTYDERHTLMCYSMSGTAIYHDGGMTVLMGSTAYDRINAYQKILIRIPI